VGVRHCCRARCPPLRTTGTPRPPCPPCMPRAQMLLTLASACAEADWAHHLQACHAHDAWALAIRLDREFGFAGMPSTLLSRPPPQLCSTDSQVSSAGARRLSVPGSCVRVSPMHKRCRACMQAGGVAAGEARSQACQLIRTPGPGAAGSLLHGQLKMPPWC